MIWTQSSSGSLSIIEIQSNPKEKRYWKVDVLGLLFVAIYLNLSVKFFFKNYIIDKFRPMCVKTFENTYNGVWNKKVSRWRWRGADLPYLLGGSRRPFTGETFCFVWYYLDLSINSLLIYILNLHKAPACEHAFCRACITEWISRQPTCPVDRQAVTASQLRPVPRILRNLLSRWVFHNLLHDQPLLVSHS